MRIFTRYMAGKFLGPFLFGLGVFALLIFLGDLFDKMNKLATTQAPVGMIAQYLLLELPYWAIRVVPMATLLAVLFAVTGFVRSGEFVAVQAAGFQAKSLLRPLLWMALLVTCASFVAQETVLPVCYRRAQHLWRETIHPEWEWDKFFDIVLAVGQNRFVSTAEFNVKKGSLQRPVMDDYDSERLVRQVDAKSARWDPAKARWVFENGVVRTFDEDGEVSGETPFETHESDLRTSPRKLRPYRRNADELSMLETKDLIERKKRLGQPTHYERTAFHAKLAYPFTNLILAALGIPIALRMRRMSRPAAFGAALVVGFLYLWFIEMGWHLGRTGRLPPPVAAWIANAVFGLLSIWLIRKSEA